MTSKNISHDMNFNLKAVSALKSAYSDLGDDADLLHDTIEGQTDLFEIIDTIVERMEEDDELLEGIKVRKSIVAARESRIKRRVEMYRAMIEQAMSIAEIKTLERPTATMTIKRKNPVPKIEDESAIPAEYWKNKPVLDKKKLNEDIKNKDIPGVYLDNGGIALQIRRR